MKSKNLISNYEGYKNVHNYGQPHQYTHQPLPHESVLRAEHPPVKVSEVLPNPLYPLYPLSYYENSQLFYPPPPSIHIVTHQIKPIKHVVTHRVEPVRCIFLNLKFNIVLK